MEKIKNIISPGHNKDESVLYGSGDRENLRDTEGTRVGTSQQPAQSATGAGQDQSKWDPLHAQYQQPNTTQDQGLAHRPHHPDPGTGKEGHKWDTFLGRYVPIHSGDSTDHHSRPMMTGDNGTNASIKSGVQGYPPSKTDPISSGVPPTGEPGTGIGRDAALGSSVLPTGTGHHHPHGTTEDYQSTTGRAFPLTGSTTSQTVPDTTVPHTTTGAGHPETSPVAFVDRVVRDHTHKGIGHNYVGDPCEHTDKTLPHMVPGPHLTDTANRIDPHVAANANLPTEHVSTTGIGAAPITTGTTPATGFDSTGTRSEHDSHVGRNTAIAGAGGAGVLGALTGGRDHHHHTTTENQPTTVVGEHKSPYSSNAVDPRLDSTGTTGAHGSHRLGKDRTGRDGDSSSDEESRKKKSGGLLGFLHKDKNKTATDKHPHTEHSGHHGITPAAAGGVGIGVVAADEGLRTQRPEGLHRHDSLSSSDDEVTTDRTNRKERKSKKGGLTGLLHSDKDKHTTGTVPTTEHDRHHGVAPVVGVGAVGAGAGAGALAHDHLRDRDLAHGQSIHDRDVTHHDAAHHDKEKKSGGLLGFLHKDKNNDHVEHDPAHDHHRTPGALAGAGVVGAGAGAGAVAYNQTGDRHAPGTVPYAEHDRHHGVAPVATTATTAPTGTTGTTGTTGLHDPAHHDKEKKSGGLLGFLHKDKDKDHSEHDPAHDHHRTTGALAGTGAVGAGAGALAYNEAREKELQHEREAREKEFARQRAEQEKAIAKEHHALEKEHHRHEKELAKEHDRHHHAHDDDKEKKGGLLGGLLHHDKDKDRDVDRHAPVQAEPQYDTHRSGHHVGTTHEAYGPDDHDRNRLHKDPPPRIAEELAAKSGVGSSGATEYGAGQTVTEPHTGLPMDVGKGDGRGGTDANAPIHGYRGV